MEISLIKFENNIITFSTSCSKGTYIRVLCEDIAEKLGTVGLMQNLIRTRVDKFDIKDSFTLENVEKANIIGIEEIFINNKKIELDRRKTELFLNGVKLNFNEDDGLYRIYNNNIFIGLGIIKSNSLKRDVIIIDNFKNNV